MRSDIHFPVRREKRNADAAVDIGDRIAKEISGLDARQRLDLRLKLAAQLCEDGAFGAVGLWPAEKIAAAVLLAAQIERLLRADNG